ncbi:proteasome-type protease [Microcoleus sp. FACHB-1515]|uniref:proteasome-type protease n=1 Tax=Cyanophyceae TaxID=3028117 RepID=UPI0016851687|nr:proteasome-type protease [Microcoleus sp. FACHB-1515]MBD2090999.1 proteasome-type protease [Microcoleus sp. FACHB-1515]
MTYCLGIITRDGLVMAADSRTNAGVDNISTYQKLFDFSRSGDRVLLLCTAGNLSVTQAVLNLLDRDLHVAQENLHSLPSLNEVARYIGSKIRQVQEQDRSWLERDRIDFKCSLLLGGQIQGEPPQLYLIYSQGNFIQATPETPFLQIGETKYGKPILDRTIRPDTPLGDAAKCALMSIDSTMKSNISVGPPINLVAYKANSFIIQHQLRLRMGDPYLMKIRQHWEISLRQAFESMPDIAWDAPAVEAVAIDADL